MNKLIYTAAASLMAAALCVSAPAQNHGNDRRDDHHDDQRFGQRNDHDDGRGGQRNNRGQAQQYDNNRYVRHSDWRRGSRLAPSDWNRGDRVDYRQYHLAAPRRGYEWRRVDGNFVMAAVATGLVASLIVASTQR